MTVGEYLRQWLSSYCENRLAENTVRGYRVNIENHTIPHIGDIDLFDLQPNDIQQMYAKLLKGGLSNTTVRYVHAVLRRAFNCGLRQRTLTFNPVDCVYPPRHTRYRGDVLDGNDLVKLVAACQGTDIYIAVLLAATLGLRRGEILGLKWSDINFRENTMQIQRTATFYKNTGLVLSDPKTQTSNRSLLVPHYVMQRLREWFESTKDLPNPLNLVNMRPSGALLNSGMLNKMYLVALERAGLPRIRFHDLRHSNATLMLRNKVPARIVADRFGHSSVGITLDLYSHVLTDMQEPAVEVIENLFR